MRKRGDELDLRIPWAYLTYSDPSSNRIWVPHADGTVTSQPAGPIGIEIVDGSTVATTSGFSWKPWSSVTWHERRKGGWPSVAQAMADVSGWSDRPAR